MTIAIRTTICSLLLASLLSTASCGDDDDSLVADSGAADSGGGAAGTGDTEDAGPDASAPMACEALDAGAAVSACAEDGDYAPCAADDWPACVSDDGEYHRVEETISTIARVEAFEQIATLLFDPMLDPSPDDFLEARLLYQTEEGLDSRVVRRFDPHFDAPEGTDCSVAEGVETQPDYCVGPAILQPALLDAFNAGAAGDAPREQAAIIEGTLLWFFYASVAKEGLSCTDVAKDCDSAYAYYTGGEAARGGIGLAGYVARADPDAHERTWDGILGLRCWRDLDDGEIAADEALRERARDQLDRALLDGVAAVLLARIEQAKAAIDDERAAHVAFVRALGPSLLREARVRSASDATALEDALALDEPTDAELDAASGALDALFGCP